MAGPAIHIEAFGEDIISRRLLRFSHNVRDARPHLRRVATILNASAQAQFATEGAFGGEKWAPLAESTLRRKGAGLPILVNTGALRDSLTHGGSGHVERILPTLLEWGSDVPYGVFHMRGTSRMPARPPVRLPETVKRRIVREIQRAVIEDLRGDG